MKTENDNQTGDGCDLLNDKQAVMFRMRGNSMYPILRDGDNGIVNKCKPEDLKIGDIVVFKSGINYVAHRLIGIKVQENDTQFIAQGDKNPKSDEPFKPSALSGIIITFTHKGKIKSVKNLHALLHAFLIKHSRPIVIPYYNLSLRIITYYRKIGDNLKSLLQNMNIIGKGTKKQFIQNSVLSVLQGFLPFLLIICMKLLVDALTKTTVQDVSIFGNQLVLLIITALMFLLNALIVLVKGYNMERMSHSVTHQAYEMLHKKHAELDLSSYEDPSRQDKIYRAVLEAGFRPAKIMGEHLNLIKNLTSVLVMLILFASIQWYLVLLLLAAIVPGVLIRLKYSGKRYQQKKDQSTKEREMGYYNRILSGTPFAKELRLFGFSDSFLRRFLNIEDNLYKERIELKRSELRADVFSQIFAVFLIFASLAYVVYLKTIGMVSLGSVVLFFFVFQRGFSVLTDLFRSFTTLVEDNTFLSDFTSFLNYPVKTENNENISPPCPLTNGITVENLSFRYDNSKRDALSSVSLNIPAGKKVAFVGANGSGKTTMIKLLSGFYIPVEGKIKFDGIDLKDLDRDALRKQITAVFQDFALYNITANENIGLGDIIKPFDIEKVRKAAESAGVAELLENLPDGYQTLLGNLFSNGEELSIGQWQKIAIARAFYRDSPIIFMDEPSSALDIESEKQLLESLKEMGKDKTVVIISHRLSTVEWADLIYVFDKGEIVESGSHRELMDLEGIYYQMVQTAGNH